MDYTIKTTKREAIKVQTLPTYRATEFSSGIYRVVTQIFEHDGITLGLIKYNNQTLPVYRAGSDRLWSVGIPAPVYGVFCPIIYCNPDPTIDDLLTKNQESESDDLDYTDLVYYYSKMVSVEKSRDYQRQRVYDAENSVFSYIQQFSFNDAEQFVNDLCKDLKIAPITLVKNKQFGSDNGVCTAYTQSRKIKIKKWGLNKHVLLHEIAHIIAPHGAMHNPIFTAILLHLVSLYNPNYFDRLIQAFDAFGVDYLDPHNNLIENTRSRSNHDLKLIDKNTESVMIKYCDRYGETNTREVELITRQYDHGITIEQRPYSASRKYYRLSHNDQYIGDYWKLTDALKRGSEITR